MGVMKML